MSASGAPSWRQAQEQITWTPAQRSVLDDLEKLYLQVQTDCNTALDALQTEKAVVAQLQTELTSSRQVVVNESQTLHELTVAKQAIAAKEEAQRLLQERMDRLQGEADQLRAEISRLNQSNETLQAELSSHQVASRLQESQAIPLFHEKQRLQTELDSIQAHASWLEQELADKQKLISKLRQDGSDHLLQVQMQLDMVTNEKDAAVAKHSELAKMEVRLQEKVTELSRDLVAAKQDAALRQQEHDLELASERKLSGLQKQQLEQLKQRTKTLERQITAMQRAAEQAVTLADQEQQTLRNELEAKYQTLLEQQAAELQKQAVVPRLTGVARGLALMENANAAAGRPKDDGSAMDEDDGNNDDDEEPLGLTEMYTRYHETKRALKKTQQEKDHCQSLLFDLKREIEAVAPALTLQREEYDKAMDQIKEYESRLLHVLEERDAAGREARDARHEVASLHRELKALKQENHVLAEQVQALLRKEAGGTVDPSFPVNVAQMQSQNQKLLTERVRLQEKISELEGRLQTDVLRTRLDATEKELHELKDERTKQEEIVDKIVRQRDLYRALANQNGNNFGTALEEESAIQQISQQAERSSRLEQKNRDLEKQLAEARGQVDALKRENDDKVERLKQREQHATELVDKISQHERELLTARGSVARAESDALYHKEKCERLEESLQRARNEIVQINNANTQLQRINTDLHHAVSKANSQCMSQESEKNQAEMKIRLLETQLQTARASEGRMTEENNRLVADMARQGSMMDNIRRIETRLAAKSEGEIASALEEAERLRGQLERDQSKNSSLVEDLHGRISTLEIRLQEADSLKAKALDEVATLKKQLLEAHNEGKEFSAKISELEAHLRSARRKLGEIADDDETKVEMSLRNRIKVLDDELELSKSEVEALKKQAGHYQKIASESDEALAELSAAVKQMEEKSTRDLGELQGQVDLLQQDNTAKQQVIVELTNDLANHRGERETTEAALRTEISSLQSRIQSNSDDTEAAKASAAAIKLDMEQLREERDTALNNYERELNVHAESRTALRQAREQAEKEKHARYSAEEKADSVQQEFDKRLELWNSEKVSLDESVKLLEKNLASAREQNDLLHKQLDSLQSAMDKQFQGAESEAGSASASEPSSASLDDLRKSLAEAREINKIVRSDNEILQTELDNSKRVLERERASVSVIRRSLDDARAELLQLQTQNDSSSTAAQVAELKEKIVALESQSALLGDSNNLLRENVGKLQEALAAAQNELVDAKNALQPNEQAKRELESKVAILTVENESLRRDLDDWKNRVQSIVSKFNQVDPVEHSQLKKKVEDLAKENESLSAWKRATEDENTRMRTIATKLKDKNIALQKEIQSLKVQVASAAKTSTVAELSAVVKERDELTAKIADMEKETTSRTKEASALSAQTENLRKRLRQLMAEKQESTNTESALKTRVASLEEQLAAEKSRQPEPAVASLKPSTDSSGAARDGGPKTSTSIVEQQQSPAPPAQSIVPSVPSEGFKFGPSLRHKTDQAPKRSSPTISKAASAASSDVAAVANSDDVKAVPHMAAPSVESAPAGLSPAASALRPSAPTFVPKPNETPESVRSPTPPSIQKELSIKERLMEKKRKLQMVISRQAAEKVVSAEAPVDQETTESVVASPAAGELPETKRRKTSSDEAEASDSKQVDAAPTVTLDSNVQAAIEQPAEESGEPAKTEQSADESVEVAQEPEKSEATPPPSSSEPSVAAEEDTAADAEPETVPTEAIVVDIAPVDDAITMIPEEEEGECDEDDVNDDEDDDDVIEAEPVVEEKPAETTATPSIFGMAATQTPFGGFGASVTAPVFGQSLKADLSFGGMAAAATSAAPFGPTGGAFLDMKPPGASSAAPTFSFGSSPSITLPIPTQAPPAPSPFGAFGTSSSTSSAAGGFTFGQSTSTFGARPLFGASTVAADVMEDEQEVVLEEEEDQMEDNDGDMDADE